MLGTVHTPGKTMLGLVIIFFLIFMLLTGIRPWAGPRTLLNAVGRFMIAEETVIRTTGYNTINTSNFLIRYQGNKTDAQMVAEAAETARQNVDAFFGHSIKGQIPVVVYSSTEQLASSMGWDRSQQAMGVYWAGTIKVLDPSVWVDRNDPYTDFYLNGPMVHEYTHMQVDYLTGGNYPRWFTEGLAQYVEKQVNGFQFAVPKQTGVPYTLDKLSQGFDQLDEAQAYWQSLTAVEYIIEKYGEQAPMTIMHLLKQGYTMPQALDKVCGSYDNLAAELYAQWQ
ncbi:MAG: peptidase MA family metallohydrolase [Methylocystaceae bacterium]